MRAVVLVAFFLSVALSQLPIPEPSWDHIDKPLEDNKKESWSGLNVNPSVKIRMAQGVSDMIKQHLLAYGRYYLNTGHFLKDHGKF